MISEFKPVYPVSPLLKEYIYCFYTLKSDADNFQSRHYSFPHTFNAVTIYCGASIHYTGGQLAVTGNGSNNISCVLQGKRQSPLLVDMGGVLSRVTILFKPLGLNHFIDEALGDLITADPCLFNAWTIPADLFDDTRSVQMQLLENLLIRYYRPFTQRSLQQALELLADVHSDRSMEMVAATAGLSLRTFNRLFKKHLGVSPITHQRIARFRYSLENKLFDERSKSLSDITHESNFYDQSYLIKFYRQFTGSNPSDLLCKLAQVGDSRLVFEFKTYNPVKSG
ncbi:AraC family transcriptional regulator [Mucilaginibacter pallidiroseus]|uniref:AraC family transcriptional regulator n=1 Tax=Mucilaginibacter pallidiroseus TaxID=2599295 RepID=A0A563UC37_9SPHI|nr:helix-turn-helix domain-containing protein [Mucilaginibacter pallidiroseus]TWR28904.1 AraC family transcriptional regulator [Mucilaginibacter pallidiroseus]